MMKRVFIHYVIKDDKVTENEALIHNIFKELQQLKLKSLNYAVYKMGDNVFVHVVHFQNDSTNKIFMDLSSVKAFQNTLSSRLSEKSVENDVIQIGSY